MEFIDEFPMDPYTQNPHIPQKNPKPTLFPFIGFLQTRLLKLRNKNERIQKIIVAVNGGIQKLDQIDLNYALLRQQLQQRRLGDLQRAALNRVVVVQVRKVVLGLGLRRRRHRRGVRNRRLEVVLHRHSRRKGLPVPVRHEPRLHPLPPVLGALHDMGVRLRNGVLLLALLFAALLVLQAGQVREDGVLALVVVRPVAPRALRVVLHFDRVPDFVLEVLGKAGLEGRGQVVLLRLAESRALLEEELALPGLAVGHRVLLQALLRVHVRHVVHWSGYLRCRT